MVHLAFDKVGGRLGARVGRQGSGQQLRGGSDGGEGFAQFERQHGEELILAAVGTAQRLLYLAQGVHLVPDLVLASSCTNGGLNCAHQGSRRSGTVENRHVSQGREQPGRWGG